MSDEKYFGLRELISTSSYLDLNSPKLDDLPDGIFQGCTRLFDLSLRDMPIKKLGSTLFNDLINLKRLVLVCLHLKSLPTGIFDHLLELDSLQLSSLQVREISPGLFDKLTKLRSLKLTGLKITDLPSGLFQELTQLKYLTLDALPIQKLMKDHFIGLNNLLTLKLSRLPISTIQPDIFQLLSRLETLVLKNLSFAIDSELLSPLRQLSHLYLHNLPYALHEWTQLNSLNSLFLRYKDPIAFEQGTLDNMKNLHFLGISSLVEFLPDDILQSSTNLEQIQFQYTGLEQLPNLTNLKKLRGVILHHNGLKNIEELGKLHNLVYINLKEPRLTEIPQQILDLPNLYSITITNEMAKNISMKKIEASRRISENKFRIRVAK